MLFRSVVLVKVTRGSRLAVVKSNASFGSTRSVAVKAKEGVIMANPVRVDQVYNQAKVEHCQS